VTHSQYYEWVSGVLIASNAVFLGWQTQYMASRVPDAVARNEPVEQGLPTTFIAMQVAYAALFAMELIPRWVCYGFLAFFHDSDRWWNVMDVFVVGFSIIDLVLEIFIGGQDVLQNVSFLRVIRVVRIVRVARVIRIMRFFRELRLMIFSILKSLKSLVWVCLVLGMMFYVFGISFTTAATSTVDTKDKWVNEEMEDLIRYFGSLDKSVLSLFMAMSGGREWIAFYSALQPLPVYYSVLFLVYIAFALFAVVNIVTGVFVESALQSNNQDKVVTANEEMHAKEDYLRSMRDIFEEMDEDDTGLISQAEFEAKLSDERVIAYFKAMKLDVSEARKLFWLIDYDQSDEIDIDEFVGGCYKLQGESRNLDIKFMQCEVHYLRQSFNGFATVLHSLRDCVVDLQNRFDSQP